MTTLARFAVGRILLHLVAMAGDQHVRFHLAGIIRELPWLETGLMLLARMRSRLIDRIVQYLSQPRNPGCPAADVDQLSLTTILKRGDVLLTDGNTRVATLVKHLTKSTWSHVSMYVGPLQDGTDPLCIVEADAAAGVRSIRLSELNALQVRVLRPIGLDDTDCCRLAEWVVGRIGSEYDLAHAWALARDRSWLPIPSRRRRPPETNVTNATRYICCSLLATSFAMVGYPITPTSLQRTSAMDFHDLIPGDFAHASTFEVVPPMNESH